MLAWAWRIASRRGLGSMAARLAAMLAALPVLAAVLAGVPAPPTLAWPTVAGLGGAIGRLLASVGLAAAASVLGPVGALMIWTIGLALAVTLTLLALGLSASEWRAAGRVVARDRVALAARPAADAGAGAAAPAALAAFSAAARRPPLSGASRRAADAAGAARWTSRRRWWRAPRGSPPRRARRPRQESLPLPEGGWRFPPLSLLKPAPARAPAGPSEEALQANARLLETVLADYGVQGSIVEIRPGPVVTLYELEPAPGIRSARVIGLADDVARSLSVTAVRIATVPGRNVIGIEVPNAKRETVFLSEILSSEELRQACRAG